MSAIELTSAQHEKMQAAAAKRARKLLRYTETVAATCRRDQMEAVFARGLPIPPLLEIYPEEPND